MVLGVRIVGRDSESRDFDELTHTLDIALGGARIAGIYKRTLRVGDVVELRRKHRRARFRVVWVGERDSGKDGQAGLRAIDAAADFWELPMPMQGDLPLPITARVYRPEETRRPTPAK
jgi:hypothetical protein